MLKNRYGYEVIVEKNNKNEFIISVPKSLFTRSGVDGDGSLNFCDFEGGPFLQVDSTFTLEGLEFRIGRIEKVEGVGYKVIRKIS